MLVEWLIGVDGGGSKTDVALSSLDGTLKSMIRLEGCSFQSIGHQRASSLVADGIKQCLEQAQASFSDCAGCCIGLPCFGENSQDDEIMKELLINKLSPMPVTIVNDVEIGWAGGSGGREGIHIVAGTGSIAFACDKDGKSARCGGWSEFFGDEGSCYWIARQTMTAFSKQADGRISKGALYNIVSNALSLSQDFEFAQLVAREIAPYRDRVARFQTIAEKAALAGDKSVIAIYKQAADELSQMVVALKSKLSFSQGETPVSYSGGLFKAKALILKPLEKRLKLLSCKLTEPKMSAVEGALLIAKERYNRGKEICF